MEANWGSWPPKGWVFVRSLSYFGQNLWLFLDFDNVLSISVKMEQKQQEITLLMENLLTKMTLKVWSQRKTAFFLNNFLSFSVEIWNHVQQIEFFPPKWALSFLKTHKKNACNTYRSVQLKQAFFHRFCGIKNNRISETMSLGEKSLSLAKYPFILMEEIWNFPWV